MNVPSYAELRLETLFVEQDATSGAEATRLAQEALARVAPGDATWGVGKVAPDPLHPGRFGVELVAPANAALPAARGWELAHSLQPQLTNARVEPTFEQLDVPAPPSVGPVGAFDEQVEVSGAAPPNDVTWHLELIHAKDAQAWLAQQAGSSADVLIGHPDTGYTQHPDIFGAGTAIPQATGHDFLDGDDNATDPLDAGVLRQPGHGTATASVLAARADNLVRRVGGGAEVDLRGVAPFVKILPLRVTRSVIVFGWQRRLAEAIEYAVARGCRVISMSVGGLGGRRLERAIEEAESQGVIVIAAAGNEVGFVVAPASYPTVVACAAIGPDRKAWTGSSRGPAVDITAPGHQVWVAGWEAAVPVARTGSGTSFATACVAGAAALWLRAHAAKLATRPRQAAALFRQALRDTAQAADLPEGFGAGILDCQALVQSFPEHDLTESSPQRALGHEEANLAALLDRRAARELSRNLEPAAAAELGFYLTIDEALRQHWQTFGPASAFEAEAAAAAAPTPSHASARLRSALRRARARSAEPKQVGPAAEPAPPRLTASAASIPSDDMVTVGSVSIVIELRINVTREGE